MGHGSMSATNDYILGHEARRRLEPDMPVTMGYEGSRIIARTLFRVIGTALILTAPLMWVLPGMETTGIAALMKLGVTVFFFLCGLALLMRNHVDTMPEVFFDPIRRELRVLQKNDRGRPEVTMRRSYDSLGGARISARTLELWDVDGSVLMRLPIENPDIRQALRMQLSAQVRAGEY